MKEQDIVRTILQYLGFRRIMAWRNNTGAFINDKHFYRFGDLGSPDIFAVKDGKIYGFEVKLPKGKQSENQKVWQKRFETAGGIYQVVFGVDEVKI